MSEAKAGRGGGPAASATDPAGLTGRLEVRLQELQAEQAQSIPLSEVGAIVADLLLTLDGDITSADVQLQNELRSLADYIHRAHQELADLKAGDLGRRQIPDATDQLDAVVQATEEATGIFLDAAEEVQAIAREMNNAQGQRLNEIANRIFEASNFQDITGQRITKVVTTLRHIEERILWLTDTFGLQDDEEGRAGEDSRRAARAGGAPSEDAEAGLLNGPQLPEKANSQADIDALFDSFD